MNDLDIEKIKNHWIETSNDDFKTTNHEESDIDIAVVLEEFENSLDMQLDLMRLRRRIDSRIEPHPFREKDFNDSNPVAHEIMQYGKRIDIATG